jgi:hypothetical protein
MSLVGIPFSQYFSVHQHASVAAGSTNTRVFYGQIPQSCVGFLYKFGNNYHSSTYLTWIIDGVKIEKQIERQIGSVDRPAQFNEENGGPYLVKSYIEVTATNPTSEDLTFEVLADGVCFQTRV